MSGRRMTSVTLHRVWHEHQRGPPADRVFLGEVRGGRAFLVNKHSSSSLLLSRQELSDSQVYAP